MRRFPSGFERAFTTALARRAENALVALAASLALAALAAAALAGVAHAATKPMNGFVGGTVSSGPGGVNSGGLFTQPRDVAVYTGSLGDPGDDKIFVAEGAGNNNRIQRLDSDGNFELIWGRDVIRPNAPGDTGIGFEICLVAEDCKEGATGSAAGELSNPMGVAVNQTTGHVYVRDRNNLRVQEFDLDGNFVRAWGWGVATGAAAFEICTSNCLQGLAGAGAGQFGNSTASSSVTGIAVDPVNGDVFAADVANRRVQQFSSTGAFIDEFGAAGTGLGEFGAPGPLRVAVDSNHVVYVGDTNESNRIQRYDAAGDVFLPPIACCDPEPGEPLVDGVTVGLEVVPDTDGPGGAEEHLLVARNPATGDTVVQELDIPDPVSGVPTPVDVHPFVSAPGASEQDKNVNGIGYSPTTGYIFLAVPVVEPPPVGPFAGCDPSKGQASVQSCIGLVVLATTDETPGLLSALDAPVDIGASTVTLEGEVNAGGGIARYRFQISSDGGASWEDVGAERYVSGGESVSVTTDVTGLDPVTPYQARLVIAKLTAYDNLEEVFSTQSFVTDPDSPDVDTLQAVRLRPNSAELRALVDPNGADTTYRFRWGPQGGPLDQLTPEASAGSGNTLDLVAQSLTGLAPDTQYEFQVEATNDVGTSVGDVVGFRTTTSTPPPPPSLARAYELVSPAKKLSGVGVGVWYMGPATSSSVGYAAYEDERFAVQGTFGAVLVEGEYSYGNDWAFATRTPEGWVTRPGVNRRAYGPQQKTFITMGAASPSLSLMSWTSGSHKLTLFPEMEGWEDSVVGEALLVTDWEDGNWEVFAPTEPEQGGGLGQGSVTMSADGLSTVASGTNTRGLAGLGDPTHRRFDVAPEYLAGGNVYLHYAPNGLSDTFPGEGERSLVNVCTAGTVLPIPVDVGGTLKQGEQACAAPLPERDARLISPNGASLGNDFEGTISEDGSRVFFMAPDPQLFSSGEPCGSIAADLCPTQLYVRQRDAGGDVVTRWISRTEVTEENGADADQDASLMAPALFEGASKDGDKVFFRTASPLTADDPNGDGSVPAGGETTGTPSPTSWDLYMYDMPDDPDADPADGDLVRISAGPNGDGDCNSPLGGSGGSGALRFVSDDGSRAYFTCAAPLPGVASTSNGTITDPGGDASTADASNLYLYDATEPGDAQWRFVARLPRTSELGACATTGTRVGTALAPSSDQDSKVGISTATSCVQGTADGAFVTFWTDGRLTPDDPDSVTGDVYAYDADADELSRVSAPQGGGGNAYECTIGHPTTVQCFGDGGIGRGDGSPLTRLGLATDPTSPGDRLAFFQSRSQLLPEDTDDAYDVYQWRANVNPGAQPELSLISRDLPDRTFDDDVFFVGNQDTGRNVYLATRERMTWQDKDSVLDVYTARACGETVCNGIPEPAPHVECDTLGDKCQGGGGTPTPSQNSSDSPSEGNQGPTGNRLELTLSNVSRATRRRAARTGVLPIRLRATAAGTLRITARAKVGGRTVTVAKARKRFRKAGRATVKLRLNRAAKRRLRSGRALRVKIVVRASGARAKTASVTLRRL